MGIAQVGIVGAVFRSSHAGEGMAPSPQAAKNIVPVLIQAYTLKPVYPNPPNHLWLDEGDGRVRFMNGEEGYWLKHVAVAEFDMEHQGEHETHEAHGGGNSVTWRICSSRRHPRVSNVPSVNRSRLWRRPGARGEDKPRRDHGLIGKAKERSTPHA